MCSTVHADSHSFWENGGTQIRDSTIEAMSILKTNLPRYKRYSNEIER